MFQNGDYILPDDSDILENEEEYDALNDETFGTLGDESSLDDWEQQHEQFAEIEENNRHSDDIENTLNQLLLDEVDSPSTSHKSLLDDPLYNFLENMPVDKQLIKEIKTLFAYKKKGKRNKKFTKPLDSTVTPSMATSSTVPTQGAELVRSIQTVEELERSLLKRDSQNQGKPPLIAQMPPLSGIFQGQPPPIPPPVRLPPGIYHPLGMPPQLRPPIPPHLHHQNLPPGILGVVPPPHIMHRPPVMPPRAPPGLLITPDFQVN